MDHGMAIATHGYLTEPVEVDNKPVGKPALLASVYLF